MKNTVNLNNDELETGTESCPICDAINTPAAADFKCSHFIAMNWENELYWCNSQIEQLIELVDFVQHSLENENSLDSQDKDLPKVFEIGYTNSADVIAELLVDHIKKTEVKSDNGVYIHWYMSESEYLDELITRLVSFKATIAGNNI